MTYYVSDEEGQCIVITEDKLLVADAIASIYDWNNGTVAAFISGERAFRLPIRSYIISEFLTAKT